MRKNRIINCSTGFAASRFAKKIGNELARTNSSANAYRAKGLLVNAAQFKGGFDPRDFREACCGNTATMRVQFERTFTGVEPIERRHRQEALGLILTDCLLTPQNLNFAVPTKKAGHASRIQLL